MTDSLTTGGAIVAAGWAARKVLGPTLDELGNDLKTLYALGKDRILEKASRKISDDDDGEKANVRAARDILWNGSFSSDDLCHEYFSGLLAASRTKDGKDESVIPFVDCVKSMSSRQVLLHYEIYHTMGSMIFDDDTSKHRSALTIASHEKICFQYVAFLDAGVDLFVLRKLGLISSFNYGSRDLYYEDVDKNAALPYLIATPTEFGIMLYCAAYNKLKWWQAYGLQEYKPFDGVRLPDVFSSTLEGLVDKTMKDSWRP